MSETAFTHTGRSRLIAALIVYAALAPSLAGALYVSRGLAGPRVDFLHALAWQTPVYASWAALVPLIVLAGRRLRLGRGGWLAPLPAYLVLSVPAVTGHALLTAWLEWRMNPAITEDFGVVRNALVVGRLPIDLLLYWAIVGVVYAYEYGNRLGEGEAAARALEAELARAQLQALKAQLHPHFLFNALQTITTLIGSDPERAVKMTVLLGDLLRTTLSRATSQLVPLHSEIALLRMYLAIEQVRFGERLTVDIDVADDALDVRVPDLILQPHVENALRHGLAPRKGPVTLAVRARACDGMLRLEVEDDGVGIAAPAASAGAAGAEAGLGIGHRVTAARLRGLFGEDQSFTVTVSPHGRGTLVVIEMPVVLALQAAGVEDVNG